MTSHATIPKRSHISVIIDGANKRATTLRVTTYIPRREKTDERHISRSPQARQCWAAAAPWDVRDNGCRRWHDDWARLCAGRYIQELPHLRGIAEVGVREYRRGDHLYDRVRGSVSDGVVVSARS